MSDTDIRFIARSTWQRNLLALLLGDGAPHRLIQGYPGPAYPAFLRRARARGLQLAVDPNTGTRRLVAR